nr:hypothetical protein [uncultured Methanobacterium sp.]
MTNEFIKAGDDFYAEAYNGAIALFAVAKPEVTIELPLDYVGGIFLPGNNKCAFMLVNLILSDTEIYNNKIRLQTGKTTGTAIFRVYPNIEPFKNWLETLWTETKTTGTIICDVSKGTSGETLVKSNIANGEDLSLLSIGLEYVDFKFTLTEVSGNRPTLDSLDLKFKGGI